MRILNDAKSSNLLRAGGLVAGILAIAMVLFSQQITSRAFDRDATLIRLCAEVQQKIIVSHLWFEEALAGDESINLDRDVYQPIDAALELIAVGLNGGYTKLGSVTPVEDKQARGHLLALEEAVPRWRSLASLRWEGHETRVIAGGAQDQAFDAVFREILDRAQALAHDVSLVIDRARATMMWTNAASILLLLILFTNMALARRLPRG